MTTGDDDARALVVRAIRGAFPDDVIGQVPDPDESYLASIQDELRAEVARSGAGCVFWEQPAGEPPEWGEHGDPHEDPPEQPAVARSYVLWFVGPPGDDFEIEVETEELDEEGELRLLSGTSRIGCSVAVSTVAPYAWTWIDELTDFEDGSACVPNVGGSAVSLEDGSPLDLHQRFGDLLTDAAVERLHQLADRIAGILNGHGIEASSDEVARSPLRGLSAERGLCFPARALPSGPLALCDALFFFEL